MKEKDSKTALKLLQKYAQSHELLLQENKLLKQTIDDSNKNLKINKDIINSLVAEIESVNSLINASRLTNIDDYQSKSSLNASINKGGPSKSHSTCSNSESKHNSDQFIYTKLKEENNNLFELNIKIMSEMEDLRNRVLISESICINRTHDLAKENENLKSKVFVLENQIIKKNNQLFHYKDRYEKLFNTESIIVERELLVSDPALSLSFIHQELAYYKESYKSLSAYSNCLKNSLFTTEKTNNRIMDENTNLKLFIRQKNKEMQSQSLFLKSEITRRTCITENNNNKSANQNLKSIENKENLISQNYPTESNITGYEKAFLETLSKRHRSASNTRVNPETHALETDNNQNKSWSDHLSSKLSPIYSDGWCEVLRQAGLEILEIMGLKQSKSNSLLMRIADAFEIFNQVISDKDVHIDLLIVENEKLSNEISELIRELDTYNSKLKMTGQINCSASNIASLKQPRFNMKESITKIKSKISSNSKAIVDHQIGKPIKWYELQNSSKKIKSDSISKDKNVGGKVEDKKSKTLMKQMTIESFDSKQIKPFAFKVGEGLDSIQEISNLKRILEMGK